MDCAVARNRVFRSLDGELSTQEEAELAAHVDRCSACALEMKILSLPRRLGQAIPIFEPSPFFYRKLRARLEGESRTVTIWQILVGLSRQVVPALATITLALLSVFAYTQLQSPGVDVYQAYDRIFMSGDRPQRMVIAELDENNRRERLARNCRGRTE